MASPVKELKYGSVEVCYNEVLGFGSYGKVYKAKCGQLPCAAKLLHDTLFQSGDHGVNSLLAMFEKECQFLDSIKHPNIVQYLGTEIDNPSGGPVLLMELMDKSLTRFLVRSTGSVPYHIQLNICHDVALALSYLHSNAIIHRDLSSNNVLLIGEGSRAKVTDFGMSKLTDMNPRMTPLTQCPGTTDYMPPEAIIKLPHYSSKLDCFSYGVLTIQIITKKPPNPGTASQYVDDPKYPTGRALVQFPEVERRKEHIDLIKPDHPLLPIALHCLKDRDTERPSADELCGRLAMLKKEVQYSQSQLTACNEDEAPEQPAKPVKKAEIQNLEDVDGETAIEIARLKDENKSQQSIIEQLLERVDHLLEEKYQMSEELKKLKSEEESTDGVDKWLAKRKKSSSSCSKWGTVKPAPQPMSSTYGSAAVQGNVAYFSKGSNVYSYTYSDNRWETLPESSYEDFSLAVIRGVLTTIGGRTQARNEATNCLLSLEEKSWQEHYCVMPTKKILPASVMTPTHLIVAGGKTTRYDYIGLSTVEALDVSANQWFRASSLPKHVSSPQMTLCDRLLYLSSITTMFCCSLDDLIGTLRHNSASSNDHCEEDTTWNRLANIPASHKTSLAAVDGTVLAIGNTIQSYDKTNDCWCETGHILTARSSVLTAVLPTKEVVVVGGYQHHNQHCDITEIGPVV